MQYTVLPIPRWKMVLWIYIGMVSLLCIVCVVFLVWGWRPDSPNNVPPLGAGAQQCEAAFGHPIKVGFDLDDSHRWSQLFYVKGWTVLVSFDGRRRAEQFVFGKSPLPTMHSPMMSAAEQSRLLEDFKEGSIWTVAQRDKSGSLWKREDEQAIAFYVQDSRWLIFMNKPGWEHFAKSVGLPTE